MVRPLSTVRRTIYSIIAILLFIIGIPVLILYASGYRFDESWFKLIETGGIYINTGEPNVSIRLDDEPAKVTGFFRRGVFIENLVPGIYSVQASKEGMQSWYKDLIVNGSVVTEANAFLVPENISLVVVSTLSASILPESATSTDKYIKMRNDTEVTHSTTTKTLTMFWTGRPDEAPDYFGCINATCTPQIVYSYEDKKDAVYSFDFYPNRSDVVLVETGDDVTAYELDLRNPRNNRQIYAGKGYMRVLDEEVYIIEASTTYRAILR